MDEEMFLEHYPGMLLRALPVSIVCTLTRILGDGPGPVEFGWEGGIEPPVVIHRHGHHHRPRHALLGSPFPFFPGDPLGGESPNFRRWPDVPIPPRPFPPLPPLPNSIPAPRADSPQELVSPLAESSGTEGQEDANPPSPPVNSAPPDFVFYITEEAARHLNIRGRPAATFTIEFENSSSTSVFGGTAAAMNDGPGVFDDRASHLEDDEDDEDDQEYTENVNSLPAAATLAREAGWEVISDSIITSTWRTLTNNVV